MRHRNLADPHSPLDTAALANYMSTKFQSATFEDAAKGIADALLVSYDELDFATRITVRTSSTCMVGSLLWDGGL